MTTFTTPLAGMLNCVVIQLTISRDLASLMVIGKRVSSYSIVKGIQHEVQ